MGIISEILKGKNKFQKPFEIFNLTYNCGQPYSIEKFLNIKNSPYLCHTCKNKAAVQYAIIDGRGEPQGSFYYCKNCDPPNIDQVVSLYLASMGYTN